MTRKNLSPDERKEQQERRLSRVRLKRAKAQLKEQETADELQTYVKG